MHCLDRFAIPRILCIHITEWTYCILDIVHFLEQTVQLCKLSEYLYTDIFCDWISRGQQDKDILCYRNKRRIRVLRASCFIFSQSIV